MNKVLIVLISSTSAFGVRSMLGKKYNISSRIVQAPAKLATLGCAFCLEINSEDLRTALNLIKVSGITVRGVYRADTYERIY